MDKEKNHSFGSFQEAHNINECDSHFTGSYTSYNTDEVHDTRSFIVGYYRGPSNKEDIEADELNSDEEQFYQELLDKPIEEQNKHLESNLISMPSNIHCVTKICLGKEHVILMTHDTNDQHSMYGFGSNYWGQLG